MVVCRPLRRFLVHSTHRSIFNSHTELIRPWNQSRLLHNTTPPHHRLLPYPPIVAGGALPWKYTLFHSHRILLDEDDDDKNTKNHNKKSSSSSPSSPSSSGGRSNNTVEDTKRLLKLVKMEDLKKHLLSTGRDSMPYVDVIKLCKDMGFATTDVGADAVARSLDDAGVIFIYRGNVFLRPNKLAGLLANALPISSIPEYDPRRKEFELLEKEKEEIDKIAHKKARHVIWGVFGGLTFQSLLFFRLTFWDLSWDVMEPITFFVTSAGLIGGLMFFIFTHREPSYQDFMHTMFSNKQKKLMTKRNFNLERFKELQAKLYTQRGSDAPSLLP